MAAAIADDLNLAWDIAPGMLQNVRTADLRLVLDSGSRFATRAHRVLQMRPSGVAGRLSVPYLQLLGLLNSLVFVFMVGT